MIANVCYQNKYNTVFVFFKGDLLNFSKKIDAVI